MTPMKAIRAKCIDCCCGSIYEPAHCTAFNCPLHPYRAGHRPKEGLDTTEAVEDENMHVGAH